MTPPLFVGKTQELLSVPLSSILVIEGGNHYSTLVTNTGRFPVSMRLHDMIKILPANMFCRVHRSYIVGLANIQAIRKDAIKVGGDEIPFNETYRQDLERLLMIIR
jgi:DNA-binding LytR/AlgR family response regulator